MGVKGDTSGAESTLSGAALKAFGSRADMSVRRVNSIWTESELDTPIINEEARRIIENKIANLRKGGEGVVTGLPVVGPAGSGKTHLLSHLRKTTIESGGYFLLANMENVKDFWDTLTHFFLFSMCQPGLGGLSQNLVLAQSLVTASGAGLASDLPLFFETAEDRALSSLSNAIFIGLWKRNMAPLFSHATVDHIRAVIFSNSMNPDLRSAGVTWIQSGADYEPDEESASYGFKARSSGPDQVMLGFSQLMSVGGRFTVVGMDQLDNVLSPPALNLKAPEGLDPDAGSAREIRAQADLARLSIQNFSMGLASLINNAASTMVVATVLADGWENLLTFASQPARHRLEARPIPLMPLTKRDQGLELARKRMSSILSGSGLKIPYPSWPFPVELFSRVDAMTPRELLRRMDAHLDACVSLGRVFECDDLGGGHQAFGRPIQTVKSPDLYAEIENRFQSLVADGVGKVRFDHAAGLKAMIDAFLQTSQPAGGAEIVLGDDSRPELRSGKFVFEHLRFFSDIDRPPDRALSLWIINHPHPRSFQSQLKSALVQSGVDPGIPGRRLGVIRFAPVSQGPVTMARVEEFNKIGTGFWLRPSRKDLAIMNALAEISKNPPEDYQAWLKIRQPVNDISFAAQHLSWLAGEAPAAAVKQAESGQALSYGWEIDLHNGEVAGVASIRRSDLTKHALILGATGTGKTFLLKRLVDEAAIQGIPSIVLDSNGDLSFLGQRWVTPPDRWLPGDQQKADKLRDEVEVVIWTPGDAKGNPLAFRVIPDFSLFSGDEDAIRRAIDGAITVLTGFLGGKISSQNEAVIRTCLRRLADNGGESGLEDLIRLLEKLPADVEKELFDGSAGLGKSLARELKAAVVNHPELASGDTVDMSRLLRSESGQTRVSVVHLGGLGTPKLAQAFVEQLVDRLFWWISRNPAGHGDLAGLLVIDEASNFVPARAFRLCKKSIIAFANQARKYGFGLLLASQEFSSVDLQAVTNCATLLLGRQSAKTSIANANLLLGNQDGVNVGSLADFRFYLKSPLGENRLGHDSIRLVESVFSLSSHDVPPFYDEIVEVAAKRAKRF